MNGVPVHIVNDTRVASRKQTSPPASFGLVAQRHRGTFLAALPRRDDRYGVLQYLVMNFASNCPFDCSYCFLQDYLSNNPALKDSRTQRML